MPASAWNHWETYYRELLERIDAEKLHLADLEEGRISLVRDGVNLVPEWIERSRATVAVLERVAAKVKADQLDADGLELIDGKE